MNTEANNGAQKKKSKNSFLPALLVVLLLMSTSINLFSMLRKGEEPVKLPSMPGKSGSIYKIYGPLDFTVNLADSGQRRYLKATIALAYEKKNVAKELEQRKAQVRDLMIGTLRSKTADELAANETRELLRKQLVEEVNAVMTNGLVTDLYFVDFLVQ